MKRDLRELLGGLRWLHGGVVAIIGVVSAVWVFGEKLTTLWDSEVPLRAYVAIDSLKLELLAVAVLGVAVMLFPPIGLRGAPRMIAREWSTSGRGKVRVLSWIALAIAGVVLIATQARFYVAGKQVALERAIPRRLLLKANDMYIGGYSWLSTFYLKACVSAFKSKRCVQNLDTIGKREAKAELLRQIYDRLPLSNPAKLRTLASIAFLTADMQRYYADLGELERARDVASSQLRDALQAIVDRKYDVAGASLETLHATAPSFGDEQVFREELERLGGPNTIDFDTTPYVASLQRYGVEETQRMLLKSLARQIEVAKTYVPSWLAAQDTE